MNKKRLGKEVSLLKIIEPLKKGWSLRYSHVCLRCCLELDWLLLCLSNLAVSGGPTCVVVLLVVVRFVLKGKLAGFPHCRVQCHSGPGGEFKCLLVENSELLRKMEFHLNFTLIVFCVWVDFWELVVLLEGRLWRLEYVLAVFSSRVLAVFTSRVLAVFNSRVLAVFSYRMEAGFFNV